MRMAKLHRKTNETDIRVVLRLDGGGRYRVSTGIRFLDHMLELFTRHGGFDLELTAAGDLDVDQHHTVEDAGIALGEAFNTALGDKRGILRAGYFLMPMDETLGLAAVDFGGRSHAVVETKVRARLVGDLQADLVHESPDGGVAAPSRPATGKGPRLLLVLPVCGCDEDGDLGLCDGCAYQHGAGNHGRRPAAAEPESSISSRVLGPLDFDDGWRARSVAPGFLRLRIGTLEPHSRVDRRPSAPGAASRFMAA